jgi:hypothetical protein
MSQTDLHGVGWVNGDVKESKTRFQGLESYQAVSEPHTACPPHFCSEGVKAGTQT